MRITVLYGGPSAEREISLISGQAVADGLRQVGHDVRLVDIRPDDLSALDEPADVIFPVLHGEFGEDGQIQSILESRNLPFVGSGSEASRIGMDKIATKTRWQAHQIPTPRWEMVSSENPTIHFPGPWIVKPIASGSSIDVFLCQTEAETRSAVRKLVLKQGRCMIEEFIQGPELTIGLLDGQALPPIRIETSHRFFDYQAKYTPGGAKHSFELDLPGPLIQHCKSLVEQANRAIGARDMARIDLMIDHRTQQPYLLEINTIPGFTPLSLLPEAALQSGILFPQLVNRLVNMAWNRRSNPTPLKAY
jgi:D-alanine-D-alanine ligase